MTVKELVRALAAHHPDADVVLCCDGQQAIVKTLQTVETRAFNRTFTCIHIGDATCVELRSKHGIVLPE